MSKEAPPRNETLEAALQFATGLVTAPIISEMTERAGVYRSQVAIGNDAASGVIRMTLVAGRFRVTTIEEARRYIAWLVERNETRPLRRRSRSMSARSS